MNMISKSDSPIIGTKKGEWLLTYQEGHGKSKFLSKFGYDINDPLRLLIYVEGGTDFKTLKFSRITEYGINCKTMTILNGYIVTSVWEVGSNLTIRFVTLIPGGEREWKRN